MAHGEVLLRFDGVSFSHGPTKPILKEASFSVRRGTKVTLMGQNGAGKSTIFHLISKELKPSEGHIHIKDDVSVAVAQQVMPMDQMECTVREFFARCLEGKTGKRVHDIDPKINEILEVVNLLAPYEKKIKTFSGGQQARLLLASALIQNPDLLLLDEPTNNLDKEGILHLTQFLACYEKTVIVISHDAEFLNAFTDGVLYLGVLTKKVEQYLGDYHDVVERISNRAEKEKMKNAQLAKQIQAKKDQANVFANKGGRLRMVAKRMREKAADLEEEKVDLQKEDKAIRPFRIPVVTTIPGPILTISSVTIVKNAKQKVEKVHVSLRKREHLLLTGPNGIGKTTLLEALASGKALGAVITPGIRVGYYRQDFSTLNFENTVYESLDQAMQAGGSLEGEERMRSVAAGFLITGDLMRTKVGSLSEGQKGLVAFARLVLERPELLILDEPTNHINFRHLPIIASALDAYEGAMILVSHVPEFVEKIRIDQTLDLGKY
ncbi:MAG: ATP-binding cassette domain-containing protein [bacterium]|nr:ATP-binding cassette domain-containing protein [bacterium]